MIWRKSSQSSKSKARRRRKVGIPIKIRIKVKTILKTKPPKPPKPSEPSKRKSQKQPQPLKSLKLSKHAAAATSSGPKNGTIDVIDLTEEDDKIPIVTSIRIPTINATIPIKDIPSNLANIIRDPCIQPLQNAILTCFLNVSNRRARRVPNVHPSEQDLIDHIASTLSRLPPTDHNLCEIDGIPVTLERIRRMEVPASWLDDESINGYLSLMGKIYQNVKFMSTFFFTSLTGKDRKKSYHFENVVKWTKKHSLGVFDFERVMVPINQNNSHWSMVHIDLKNHLIENYDSLGGASYGAFVIENIKRYLTDELEDKAASMISEMPPPETWETKFTSTPRQRDGGSCGVFACYFAHCLTTQEKPTLTQDDIQSFRQKMAFCLISPLVDVIVKAKNG
ncbi:hypothetical protein HDU97_001827 [Phlyctochytrium planicorne]|nr:hypothetical protein HDU97_001827 [Phlyctochytrium planicorne]